MRGEMGGRGDVWGEMGGRGAAPARDSLRQSRMAPAWSGIIRRGSGPVNTS